MAGEWTLTVLILYLYVVPSSTLIITYYQSLDEPVVVLLSEWGVAWLCSGKLERNASEYCINESIYFFVIKEKEAKKRMIKKTSVAAWLCVSKAFILSFVVKLEAEKNVVEVYFEILDFKVLRLLYSLSFLGLLWNF